MFFRLVTVFFVVILNTTLVAHSENACKDAAPIYSIAVSADMAYIAVMNTWHSVQIWNVETGKNLESVSLPTDFYLTNISFSEDGNQLLLGGNKKAVLWDIKTGKQIATFIHEPPKDLPESLVGSYFVPNSKYLITTNHFGAIVWDRYSQRKVLDLSNDAGSGEPIDISHNGKYLLIHQQIEQPDEWYQWQLWDIETLKMIYTFNGSVVDGARFTPDSKYILYYTFETAIIQWDIAAKKDFKVLSPPNKEGIDRHGMNSDRLTFSSDGQYFSLYAGGGWGLSLWNLQTGTKTHTFNADSQTYQLWAFLPNNQGVYYSYTFGMHPKSDGFVWSVEENKQLVKFDPQRLISAISGTLDGKYFFLGYEDGSLELWNTKSGKLVRSFVDCH